VVAEPGGTVSTVLFDNGVLSAGIEQDNLQKVQEVDPAGTDDEIAVASLVGKWVQLKGYPEFDAADPADQNGTPKSPAASGIVVRVYGVAAYDGEGFTGLLGVIQLGNNPNDAIVFEYDADLSPIVINETRRSV